jgi:transposase InsO family protein
LKSLKPVEVEDEARESPRVFSLIVVTSEDVCLDESVSEFFVRGKVVSLLDEDVEGSEFVFIPENHLLAEKGALLANCIVQVQDLCIPIKVMKPEFQKCVLRSGTRLGVLECLNANEGFYENVNMISTISNKVVQEDKSYLDEINTGVLAIDEKNKLFQILTEYSDIFSKGKMDIGCTQLLQHTIDTGDSAPIACSPRRVPLALEEKVDKLVEELLAHDIIRPSESPWNSPIVIVAKKNGDIRLCVDYRRLNAVTKRSVFPIPATNQLLDCLAGSSYFSTLDLSQGYHQILMAEKDIPKTAFATRRGQFEYKRMPFGLCSAPSSFQRLMHIVLRHENWEKCLIYLDDILIFGRNLEEHLVRLRAVLQRIREAGLKLSPSKCYFMKREVQYLGHVVGTDGIHTDPQKTEKVNNWPRPKTIKELKSFLGFCGYYRRFIHHYSDITHPLDVLCSQDNSIKGKGNVITGKWSDVHEEAFNSLKHALVSAPILCYPQQDCEFILDTDASNSGIGAVLSQVQQGEERVVAYGSRRLTKSERRYCVTRKELLAVYYFVKYYRHYLFGRRFKVRTDHKALLWMLNWRKPNTSQYCLWKAELEAYDMEVLHRPGVQHSNADGLSRIPDCHQCQIKHENPVTRRHAKIFPSHDTSTLSSSSHSTHIVMGVKEDRLNPSNWQIQNDPELGIIYSELLNGGLMKNLTPNSITTAGKVVRSLWEHRHNLRIRGDLLYYITNTGYKLLVPSDIRNSLVSDIHETIGHAGVSKLLSVVSSNYYWPGMVEQIKTVVRTCKECQYTKGKYAKDRAPLQPTVVSRPFERIAIDISGPFHRSINGYRYILAIVDYFSKFPVLVSLKRVDAETIAKKVFKYWIAVFGAPSIIHTDRGTCFESELFKEQCAIFGIKKTKTSPFYPQSDGLVERLFRTVKPMISATMQRHRISWCQALPFVEMGLRCSIQSSTRFSPYEVLFGKKMSLPLCWKYPLPLAEDKSTVNSNQYLQELNENLQWMHTEVMKNADLAASQQKAYYDRNRMFKEINVGDQVLVKITGHLPNKFPRNIYDGPYIVVSRKGNWNYKLKDLQTGELIDRNYNQVKIYQSAQTVRKLLSSHQTTISSATRHKETGTQGEDNVPCSTANVSVSVQPPSCDGQRYDEFRRYPRRNREPVRRFY